MPSREQPFTPEDAAQVLDAIERAGGMGCYVWDLAAGRVVWADGMFRLLGLAREDIGELTTANANDVFYARVHPDDRERVRAVHERVFTENAAPDVTYRIVRPDGVLRVVRGYGSVSRDAGGRIVMVKGALVDVTESHLTSHRLVETDALLKEIQRAAGVGSHIYDLSTGRREWSPALYHIMGVDPSVEATSELAATLVHPDDRAAQMEWGMRVARGEAMPPLVSRIVRPDGAVRYLETRARRVDSDAGPRIMGISLDVTSRVELENRLREAAKMEAVGALAAGVAHDFNNYLTVMALQLGSISTTLEGQHASAIKPLEDAIEQSATLTRQLLAFARKQPRVVRSVDMRALIETSASLFGRAAGPNVSIELRLPPDPLHVLGDPCQLDSVLMNLALNARDATSGRGTVTISLESQRLEPRDPRLPPAAASGSYVVITVRDDGVGIAPEHLPRLFEPYFSTKAAGRGTGLGLASVYGIATQHGGFVHVETAPEKGSSFLVYLPATDTLPTDTPEQCTAERDVLSGTVLVVEDMAPLREVAARILAETGLEVRIAATAGEALRVVSSALQIDLVLSDVVMPGASGFDLARQVREIAPQTSVVFMSGYADGALLERIEREAPGCPLVRKPFDTAELLGVVGRALKKARAR